MITDSFGRLFNDGGEIVAEGPCQVDHERGSVTLRPLVDTPLLLRQRGVLRLALEDGGELAVRDDIIRFRLNLPGVPPGPAYRLFMTSPSRLKSPGTGGGERDEG